MRPIGTERRNVTLAVPANVLRQARHLAVEQGVSLSKYLAQVLERDVLASAEYQRARQRWRQRVDAAQDRGTDGRVSWTRQELHER